MATFYIHEDQENIDANTGKVVFQLPRKLGSSQTSKPLTRVQLRVTGKREISKEKKLTKFLNAISIQPRVPLSQLSHGPVVAEQPPDVSAAIDVDLDEDDISIKNVNSFDNESQPCITLERCDSFGIRRGVYYVDEYADDIYEYLRKIELNTRPRPGYMRKQHDISDNMRRILVDWLVSVSEEYKMHSETLHLAVSYIDRFLSCMSVVKNKLQLVGTAAMMIAAKYEEIYPPTVAEFVYLTNDTYTKRQLLRMEHLVLKVLSFDLSSPTVLSFITEYCMANGLSHKTMYLAMYLSELAMLEGAHYLCFVPSQVAASAVALARHTLAESDAWPEKLAHKSGYTLRQLSPIIQHQHRTFRESPTRPHQAVAEKYQNDKYEQVSLLTPRFLSMEDL